MAVADAETPRLVVTGPADQVGLVLSLSAPQMVIGHSDTADLILEDRFVSRRHALVITDASGAVTILDLNSTGGTFVNDERIDEPRVLQPGDVVRFADLTRALRARRQRAGRRGGGERPYPAAGPAPGYWYRTGDGRVGRAPGAAGGTASGASGGTACGAARGASGRPPVVPPVEPPVEPPVGPAAAGFAGDPLYTVTGTVTSPALPGVAGLTVQLVDKNVGGDQVAGTTQTGGDQVLGTTQTGSGGQFSFTSLPSP